MAKLLFLLLSTFIIASDIDKEKLFDLSQEISGRSIDCNGLDYFFSLDKYIQELTADYNDPDLYEKAIEDYDKYYNYFIYWAYQSLGNYRLFKRFNDESVRFCQTHKEHFKKLSSEHYNQACYNFIQRFGKRAFGSIKSEIKLYDEYKEFLKLDKDDAIAYLNELSPSSYELDFFLKLALLSKKDLSVIDFIVKSGANINLGYENSVFYALDYYEALEYLLNNGANVNYANSFGKTPIFYAVEINDIKTIKLLIKHHANLNSKLVDNEEKIKRNLPYYISICSNIHSSSTLFIHAIMYSNLDVIKLLVENKADYIKADNFGLNAMYYAKLLNKNDIVKYLNSLKE